jgi:hypothetical protein
MEDGSLEIRKQDTVGRNYLHFWCVFILMICFVKNHYTAESDHLILEDETMRVRLVGKVEGFYTVHVFSH